MRSPAAAFASAALIVAQGALAAEQEFESFPIVATYQMPPSREGTAADDASGTELSSAGMISSVGRLVGIVSGVSVGGGVSVEAGVGVGSGSCTAPELPRTDQAVSTWLKCRLTPPFCALTNTSSRTGMTVSLGVTSIRQTSSAGRVLGRSKLSS